MFQLKTKAFAKWSKEEGIADFQLDYVLREIEQGLTGISLGAGLYKKRIAAFGKGKSGGARVIIAYKEKSRIIFIYGFSKNQIENIGDVELLALKKLSKVYLAYTDKEISYEIYKGALIEVKS